MVASNSASSAAMKLSPGTVNSVRAALADELIDQDLAPGTHHGRFTRLGRF